MTEKEKLLVDLVQQKKKNISTEEVEEWIKTNKDLMKASLNRIVNICITDIKQKKKEKTKYKFIYAKTLGIRERKVNTSKGFSIKTYVLCLNSKINSNSKNILERMLYFEVEFWGSVPKGNETEYKLHLGEECKILYKIEKWGDQNQNTNFEAYKFIPIKNSKFNLKEVELPGQLILHEEYCLQSLKMVITKVSPLEINESKYPFNYNDKLCINLSGRIITNLKDEKIMKENLLTVKIYPENKNYITLINDELDYIFKMIDKYKLTDDLTPEEQIENLERQTIEMNRLLRNQVLDVVGFSSVKEETNPDKDWENYVNMSPSYVRFYDTFLQLPELEESEESKEMDISSLNDSEKKILYKINKKIEETYFDSDKTLSRNDFNLLNEEIDSQIMDFLLDSSKEYFYEPMVNKFRPLSNNVLDQKFIDYLKSLNITPEEKKESPKKSEKEEIKEALEDLLETSPDLELEDIQKIFKSQGIKISKTNLKKLLAEVKG